MVTHVWETTIPCPFYFPSKFGSTIYIKNLHLCITIVSIKVKCSIVLNRPLYIYQDTIVTIVQIIMIIIVTNSNYYIKK